MKLCARARFECHLISALISASDCRKKKKSMHTEMDHHDQLRHIVRARTGVEFTGAELAILADHTQLYAPRESPTFHAACGLVAYSVADHIDRYGDTGYGDKSPELDRVTYWFQHLPDQISADVAAIQTPPPPLSAEIATRPPSTAKKCHGCKRKFERGRLHIVVAERVRPFYGTPLGGSTPRTAGYCFDTACIAANPWTMGRDVSKLLLDELGTKSLNPEEVAIATEGFALLATGAPSKIAREYMRVRE